MASTLRDIEAIVQNPMYIRMALTDVGTSVVNVKKPPPKAVQVSDRSSTKQQIHISSVPSKESEELPPLVGDLSDTDDEDFGDFDDESISEISSVSEFKDAYEAEIKESESYDEDELSLEDIIQIDQTAIYEHKKDSEIMCCDFKELATIVQKELASFDDEPASPESFAASSDFYEPAHEKHESEGASKSGGIVKESTKISHSVHHTIEERNAFEKRFESLTNFMVETFEETMFRELEAEENLRVARERLHHIDTEQKAQEPEVSESQEIIQNAKKDLKRIEQERKESETSKTIQSTILELDGGVSALRSLFTKSFGVKLKPAIKRTWTCVCGTINLKSSHTCTECGNWRCRECETITIQASRNCSNSSCGMERSWKCPMCETYNSVSVFKCSKCFYDLLDEPISMSRLPTLDDLKPVKLDKKSSYHVNDGHTQDKDIASETAGVVKELKHVSVPPNVADLDDDDRDLSMKKCNKCSCSNYDGHIWLKGKCRTCYHFEKDHS